MLVLTDIKQAKIGKMRTIVLLNSTNGGIVKYGY